MELGRIKTVAETLEEGIAGAVNKHKLARSKISERIEEIMVESAIILNESDSTPQTRTTAAEIIMAAAVAEKNLIARFNRR